MNDISIKQIAVGMFALCLLCGLIVIYCYNLSDAENRACEWERKYKEAQGNIKQLRQKILHLECIIAEMMLEEV